MTKIPSDNVLDVLFNIECKLFAAKQYSRYVEDDFVYVEDIDKIFQETCKELEEKQTIGVWVPIDDEPHEDYECSECGKWVTTGNANIKPEEEFRYCPNCGTRMYELKGEQNDSKS